MKIAYFGGDWHMGCIEVFQLNGHEIGHVFVNHEMPYNKNLRDYALSKKIPVSSTKPEQPLLEEIVAEGINCFFSVEYPWLIPIPDKSVKTINVHPTLLPEGKGPTPVIWLVKKYQDFAGITFHKLSSEFDSGDIIFQTPMQITENDSYETLMAKLNIEIPIHLSRLLENFDNLYQSARGQSGGSYWPKIELSHRTINWHESVYEIEKLVRACGRFGAMTTISGEMMLINHVHISQYHHQWAAGAKLREDEESYVMAASDGVVVLMKRDIVERLKQD
ncbi:MAG: hypothetical protein GY781_07850 [Gammaproteobacteria bacterium]|nr:hypothetical protein [Gammaproteobacteria bacterium]